MYFTLTFVHQMRIAISIHVGYFYPCISKFKTLQNIISKNLITSQMKPSASYLMTKNKNCILYTTISTFDVLHQSFCYCDQVIYQAMTLIELLIFYKFSHSLMISFTIFLAGFFVRISLYNILGIA